MRILGKKPCEFTCGSFNKWTWLALVTILTFAIVLPGFWALHILMQGAEQPFTLGSHVTTIVDDPIAGLVSTYFVAVGMVIWSTLWRVRRDWEDENCDEHGEPIGYSWHEDS